MMQKEMISLFDTITEKISRKIKKTDKKKANEVVGTGADGEPTKKLDKIAEEIAIKELKEHEKNYYLISEEIGEVKLGKNPEKTIILDPIDGTQNALRGLPFYSTSIGVLNQQNEIILGYVKDHINKNKYYTMNDKSYQNKNKIKVSDTNELYESSISLYYEDIPQLKKFSNTLDHLRRLGCISLELCFVASGKLDAFLDLRGAGIIDIVAGMKIVENAGGEYESINKAFPNKEIQKNIKTLCSNKKLFNKIKEELKYE